MLSTLWRLLATDTLVALICLPILLRWCAAFAPVSRAQHLVAAAADLMHPHDVHDVQADTGADPSHAATPGHKVEGLSAIDCIHTTVIDWHDGDADHEKDYCHGNAICHVGPRRLGITQYLEEPALVHTRCRKLSEQAEVRKIRQHSFALEEQGKNKEDNNNKKRMKETKTRKQNTRTPSLITITAEQEPLHF